MVNQELQSRRTGGRYVPRFAGEAFRREHFGEAGIGPDARKLASEIAWKQPPSSKIKAEVAA
jgi:hypothetical protein